MVLGVPEGMGGGSLPVWIGKQGRERGVTLGLDLGR